MLEREEEWEALREAALRNQSLIHAPLPPSLLKAAPPRTMSPFELSESSEADISNGIDHSLQAVANASQALDDTSLASDDQDDEHGDLVSLRRKCWIIVTEVYASKHSQTPLPGKHRAISRNTCVASR